MLLADHRSVSEIILILDALFTQSFLKPYLSNVFFAFILLFFSDVVTRSRLSSYLVHFKYI